MTNWLLRILPPRLHFLVLDYFWGIVIGAAMILFATVFFLSVSDRAEFETQGFHLLEIDSRISAPSAGITASVVARDASGETYRLNTSSRSQAEETSDKVCAERLVRLNGNITYRWVSQEKCRAD